MEPLKFTPDEKAQIAERVKIYFREELNQEIGGFDAELLIDFFAEEVGVYFYNRGLYDAQALFSEKVEALSESIYELEKPTAFEK